MRVYILWIVYKITMISIINVLEFKFFRIDGRGEKVFIGFDLSESLFFNKMTHIIYTML